MLRLVDGELTVVQQPMVGVSTNGVTAGEGKASQQMVGFVTPDPETGVTTLRITSLATGNEVHTEEVAALDLDSLGGGQRAFVTTFAKKDRSVGYRVLLVAADSTLCLLQQKEVVWKREEALAAVTTVQMMDLPPESQHGVVETMEDFVPALLRRLRLQLLQLKLRMRLATAEDQAELSGERRSHGEKMKETWDSQGFRKIIVVLTRPGKLLALHNGDGRVMWSVMTAKRGDRSAGETVGVTGQRASKAAAAAPAPAVLLISRVPP